MLGKERAFKIWLAQEAFLASHPELLAKATHTNGNLQSVSA